MLIEDVEKNSWVVEKKTVRAEDVYLNFTKVHWLHEAGSSSQ